MSADDLSCTSNQAAGAENNDQERPDDALDCPVCDRHFGHYSETCELCQGRGWVEYEDIERQVGDDLVPCLACGGDGEGSSFGPCAVSCEYCLGIGRMPLERLGEFTLADVYLGDQDWSGVNLSGQSLRGASFSDCNFTNVRFTHADLTQASFSSCQMAGANPEAAASLTECWMNIAGLTEQQRVICRARGVFFEDEDLGTYVPVEA